MSVDFVTSFFGWCALINMAILSLWFLLFTFFSNFIYSIHSKWFEIPRERFGILHYNGMMFFKLAIFLFNLVPYIVLRIIG